MSGCVFLTVLHKCLGGIEPVIISYRNQALLFAVQRVSGIKNHSYCLRHMQKNFLTYIGKL